MGRIIKVIWGISLFTGLGVLLYTYASLGATVSVSNDPAGGGVISKEGYFYIGLGLLVLFNFTFYTISRNMHLPDRTLQQTLINWQLSFASVLNFFYIIAAVFLMMYNSGENFDYNHFGYLVYVALAFIFLWILGLPVLLIRNRTSGELRG